MMNFTINKDALVSIMRKLNRPLTTKVKDELQIVAMDDVTFSVRGKLNIVERTNEPNIITKGSVTVDAILFKNIVTSFPKSASQVELKVDGGLMWFYCGKTNGTITIDRNKQELWKSTDFSDAESTEISAAVLEDMMKQSMYAMDKSESGRANLEGLTLQGVCGERLRVTGCDGYQMALCEDAAHTSEDFSVLVPISLALEVQRVFPKQNDGMARIYVKGDDIKIEIDTSTGMVEVSGQTKYTGDLIDFVSLFPKGAPESTINCIDHKSFVDAVGRVGKIGSYEWQTSPKSVIQKKMIHLKAENAGFAVYGSSKKASMKEDVLASVRGNDIDVCVNPDYILNALRNGANEDYMVQLYGANGVIFIDGSHGDSIRKKLIMPILQPETKKAAG